METPSFLNQQVDNNKLLTEQDDIEYENKKLLLKSKFIGEPLLYFTAAFVSVGTLLFGYSQGVMASIIVTPQFKDYFNNPTPHEISIIVSIMEIGALLSSLILNNLNYIGIDIGGRKHMIRLGSILFILGGFLQFSSINKLQLILSRLIIGFGIGILSSNVTIYLSEISSSGSRGLIGSVQFVFNIIGYSTSIWTNYASTAIFTRETNNWSWRFPFLFQLFFGVALFLGTFIIIESPRYLINYSDKKPYYKMESLLVLAKIQGKKDFLNDDSVLNEYLSILEHHLVSKLNNDHTQPVWYYMKKYKKRFIVACSALLLAQFNGINIISYYSCLLFEQAGMLGRKTVLMSGINSIIYILSTIPPCFLVDKIGRKQLLLIGAVGMGMSWLCIILIMAWNNPTYTPKLAVLFVIIFNSFFGFAWGPVPWLLASEIAPQTCRTLISSCSTAVNWLSNFIVGYITPILQDKIHYKFYILPMIFCVISFYVVKYYYPETKGLHLEDMASVFHDDVTTIRSGALSSDLNSIKRYNSIPSNLDSLNNQTSIITTPSGRYDGGIGHDTSQPVSKPAHSAVLQNAVNNNFQQARDTLLQDENVDEIDNGHIAPTTNLLTGNQLKIPTIDEFLTSKYKMNFILVDKKHIV
ncbi:hypothetical protein ACO0SA_004397 [Hanseniaspora valbyensis]